MPPPITYTGYDEDNNIAILYSPNILRKQLVLGLAYDFGHHTLDAGSNTWGPRIDSAVGLDLSSSSGSKFVKILLLQINLLKPSYAGNIVLPNGKLLLFGASRKSDIFDPSTGEWEEVTVLDDYSDSDHSIAVLNDNEVVFNRDNTDAATFRWDFTDLNNVPVQTGNLNFMREDACMARFLDTDGIATFCGKIMFYLTYSIIIY